MKDTYSIYVPNDCFESPAFTNWYDGLSGNDYYKVLAAIQKIELEGIVTTAKRLDPCGLYEKKWATVLRMYFSVANDTAKGKRTYLVYGGNKKDQNADIQWSTQHIKTSGITIETGDLKTKN